MIKIIGDCSKNSTLC